MKYRKLRELEVSAIGLGCMDMHHAYGVLRGCTYIALCEIAATLEQEGIGAEIYSIGKERSPLAGLAVHVQKLGIASSATTSMILSNMQGILKDILSALPCITVLRQALSHHF